MLGRFALVGVALVALGASSASAGSLVWKLKKQCYQQSAVQAQCAHQFATGDRNWAVTKQTVEQDKLHWSRQFSLTYQNGNDNVAYTEQVGTNQSAKTIQVGDRNFSGTFQSGNYQSSQTIQTGNGHWSATSSVGNGTSTSIESSN